MTQLKLTWNVKFRAFGITFGTIAGVRNFQLPLVISILPGPLPTKPIFEVNERGAHIVGSLVRVP